MDTTNSFYLCARMRRGYLYSRAKELGCNKIALGHHYDDVIETILMGMLYGAQIQTKLCFTPFSLYAITVLKFTFSTLPKIFREMIERNAAKLNVPITIFESAIFESVFEVEKSPCYLCARMRRGYLYTYYAALDTEITLPST